MKNHLIYIWYKYIGLFFRFLPIKNNRIVFSNFFGKGYGDNPKYIADEIIKRNLDYELIWFVKDKYYNDIPQSIKQIKRGTFKELYYLSTARIWVDNCRKHYGVTKRKGQFYLHTWHGTIGLKKMEKDCAEILKKDYIKSAISDSKMIDLIPSGSRLYTEIINSSFWYDGEIYECGTPRCDSFFHSKKKENSLCTLLYAPTFRDNGYKGAYNLDYDYIVKELNKITGKKWKIIVRFHPNESDLQKNIKYSDCVIDGSLFGDINSLIIDSDYLITDYSSSLFDSLLIKKPVFLYVPDIEQYSSLRGSYININDLPYSQAKTQNELIENIKSFDKKKFEENVNMYLDKIGNFEDGNASKRLVDRIAKVIDND